MKDFIAGQYVQQPYYKSFQPNPINRSWKIDNMELINLLSQADREMGKLDMYSEYIPNIDLFIHMNVVKEATQSNKIEGTQTTIEDALLDKESVPLDKRDDWEEVQNYVAAMTFAIKKLEELPFCSRLIRDTHKILLQGVRGNKKLPGEFRVSQNWIGGASINDAIFIPPHQSTINDLMTDLESFSHSTTNNLPILLKIALIHYQFETIHPFLDGNGRIGRLMITLFLVSTGTLKQPVLYLSDFFEKNRSNYYDKLTRVREHNDILNWLKFFLVGIIETAQKSIQTFDNILRLQKEVDIKLSGLGIRAKNATTLINYLYQSPFINITETSKLLKITNVASAKLISLLEQVNILKEITGLKRDRVYVFNDYLKLFNS
ncbi:MAG: cell filamentation protein Fic [Burkholderiales bacterium]|jgi:Fic family protein|nr:cell filamentation protein Fic [Burkholderiales bacterium]